MLDLYFWPTGNGKKIIILLEELGLPYTIKPINIGRGDQLTPDFLKISPNGRMPAIVDGRDEPRFVRQALSRSRPIHDCRYDLLSFGIELGDPEDRDRRVPECKALAGRNRRAAGRQESHGHGAGVP